VVGWTAYHNSPPPPPPTSHRQNRAVLEGTQLPTRFCDNCSGVVTDRLVAGGDVGSPTGPDVNRFWRDWRCSPLHCVRMAARTLVYLLLARRHSLPSAALNRRVLALLNAACVGTSKLLWTTYHPSTTPHPLRRIIWPFSPYHENRATPALHLAGASVWTEPLATFTFPRGARSVMIRPTLPLEQRTTLVHRRYPRTTPHHTGLTVCSHGVTAPHRVHV